METSPTPQRGSFIAKLGAWLLPVQVAGFVISSIAFMAVSDLDRSETINLKWLLFVPIGISLSLLGAILIVVAISLLRFRSSWMYRLLSFYGPLLICIYFLPVIWSASSPGFLFVFCLAHLLVGLCFLIFAVAKKDEFLRSESRLQAESCSEREG